jgi:hypothetical protein
MTVLLASMALDLRQVLLLLWLGVGTSSPAIVSFTCFIALLGMTNAFLVTGLVAVAAH